MAERREDEEIARASEVIARYGEAALGGAHAEAAARRWLSHGFADAEEIEEWLAARCFLAERARALESAGLTPEQASLRTSAGSGDYEDTVGYKYAQGHLSIEEARRIVTSDFWNG